jgi:hypothetical protein
MVRDIRSELEDAVAFGRSSPEPPPDISLRHVYAGTRGLTIHPEGGET